ncbi:hypothetical protein OIDMADRAFT_19534 [Oidiodendron maius Zn]|uniref:Uncharacterized protein n=1 Tax=Oidiodendron maius (strain Zn) TaxID=913774 RepID=A0A0C3HB57_OIDMZ|nr:hypothetical protein OIDMADRAFT_19534 [Oidiodendron maius Zn]
MQRIQPVLSNNVSKPQLTPVYALVLSLEDKEQICKRQVFAINISSTSKILTRLHTMRHL